jgi:hypothetical protein
VWAICVHICRPLWFYSDNNILWNRNITFCYFKALLHCNTLSHSSQVGLAVTRLTMTSKITGSHLERVTGSREVLFSSPQSRLVNSETVASDRPRSPPSASLNILEFIALLMGTLCTSETSVYLNASTRLHVLDSCLLHAHSRYIWSPIKVHNVKYVPLL